MKRAIRRVYIAGAVVTAVIMLLFAAMFVLVRYQTTRDSLRAILQTVSSVAYGVELEEKGETELISLSKVIAQSSPPLRVTFLNENGDVLADSEEVAANMDNHSDRPEVIAAIEGRLGESMRVSETLSVTTLYAAMRVSERLVLRLSYPMRELLTLLWIYAMYVFMLLVLLYVFLVRFFSRFSLRLHEQLENIQLILTGKTKGAIELVQTFYPELRPSMEALCYKAWRLRHDYDEIEREQTLRRDFIANASHELKSPLTSISGFAELISDGIDTTGEKRRLYAECILKESERLRGIVDDMLALARAEKDESAAPENLEDVDVASIAREVELALEPQAEEKEIVFSITGKCVTRANARDVWEILFNLMGNAVRYGNQRGHTWVSLDKDGFSVSDDGIGIAKEHIPMLFERFYRVDKAHSREMGGTGLGLSIALAIAKKYGWSITAQSQLGRGSIFYVRFVRDV
ncbi:MAG: ATP-binding protein [Clostridia bacterium]|nr:ATP-binding protein [Clostridia bacterium]